MNRRFFWYRESFDDVDTAVSGFGAGSGYIHLPVLSPVFRKEQRWTAQWRHRRGGSEKPEQEEQGQEAGIRSRKAGELVPDGSLSG